MLFLIDKVNIKIQAILCNVFIVIKRDIFPW